MQNMVLITINSMQHQQAMNCCHTTAWHTERLLQLWSWSSRMSESCSHGRMV